MSDTPGMGVLINLLLDDGTDSKAALETIKGQTIRNVEMSDEGDGSLTLTFDTAALVLRDNGRSCCESRYMTTDDEIDDFVGAEFRNVELRDGPELTSEWGEPHEQQFLYVNTSIGTLVAVTHNEHNGYYGGFWIKAELTERKE